MYEFILLSGLIVLLIAVHVYFRKSTGRWRQYFIGIPLVAFSFFACGGENNDDNDNDDSVKITTNDEPYEVYITEEDINELKEELPDSMGIIMTQSEFAGLKLFMIHCNKCHPGGEQGAGPSLNDKPLPDFMIHFQIRQGLGDMPAFTKEELTKEEVQQIVRYVRFMRKNYADAKKG